MQGRLSADGPGPAYWPYFHEFGFFVLDRLKAALCTDDWRFTNIKCFLRSLRLSDLGWFVGGCGCVGVWQNKTEQKQDLE